MFEKDMVLYYLQRHSKPVKATIEEIKAKNTEFVICDTSLTHGGGGEGVNLTSFLGSMHIGFLLPPNTFQTSKLEHFLDSAYGFLIPPNIFYGSKCNR